MKKFRIPLLFVGAAILMLLFFTDRNNFRYHYQVGGTWYYETLTATFDFPILKSQEQLSAEREQKYAESTDCYRCDENVEDQVLAAFSRFGNDSLSRAAQASLSQIYSAGVVSALNGGDMVSIRRGKNITKVPASNIYTAEEASRKFVADMHAAAAGLGADSLSVAAQISRAIVPNLYFDEQTTSKLARQAIEAISPTDGMVYAGQTVVSNGQVITTEVARMLDSYKAEFVAAYGGSTQSDLLVTLSHLMIVLLLLSVYLLVIFTSDRELLLQWRSIAFLTLLYVIMYIGASVFPAGNGTIMYLIPFSLFVLYVQEFFKDRVCLGLYLAALLPLLSLRENGVELYLMNALSGAVLLVSFRHFSRGFRQFANSAFMFAAMMFVYLAFRVITGTVLGRLAILFIALNSVLAVLGYPFIYLFERMFSLVSQMRLWELSDTNNPLLLEVARKAPGTFQHSLNVANMAEAACRAVGGNTRLVRVGALYHDIGKINNPQCFTENETAAGSYHKNLTPQQSAQDIIRHVDDGLELARRHNLPEPVVNMISSHHGTTKAMYFYTKYCNEGGDPANVEPFSYHGKLPESKEEMVLMFADSVEAASRSLKEYTPESISAVVSKIVDGKIEQGQAAKADITMGEIDTVKHVFVDYLQQMYHVRIAYPEPSKKSKSFKKKSQSFRK